MLHKRNALMPFDSSDYVFMYVYVLFLFCLQTHNRTINIVLFLFKMLYH